MYSLYVTVKCALHWMVIMFKDYGDVVHNDVISTYHKIAIYEGTPYLCCFLIYLYETCYAVSLVINIRCVL